MTEHRADVPARAHLAGNPSDGYGGAVLSTTVPTMCATVVATADERFSIGGPRDSWPTMIDLAERTRSLGYDGGDRLVRAALVTLDRALSPGIDRTPGRFEWSSTIPRSVGLGGSSAIVIATMRVALDLWQVTDRPTDLDLARLALAAETEELGIAAGLADRTAQVMGGVVHTDCRREPTARRVLPRRDIALSLHWRRAAAAPSGDYHRALRAAVDQARPETLEGLATLAALADDAATAVADGDEAGLAAAMDASLAVRRALGPVPSAALVGVDEVRAGGSAVNFAGSGGTIVVHGSWVARAGWESAPITISSEMTNM